MASRQATIRKKPRRIRNFFRSVAVACALGASGLMPLRADAGMPKISAFSHAEKKPGSSIKPDPAQDPSEKGEPGFRPLERSELSLDLRLGRMKGLDISLMPYGYSWKMQEIPYGGGLMLRLGRSMLGGEWNSRDGGLLILGYYGRFAGKRLEVMPKAYIAPQGLGGRLRVGFRIKQVMIYSDSYLMRNLRDQVNSMNFMVGISFGE